MKKLKPIARVVVYNPQVNKILLVRNKGESFWYAAGGQWEYDHENILECAKREVLEETGLTVDIKKLLYMQEFHGSPDAVCMEMFWIAQLSHEQDLNAAHVDLDPNGAVEEAKWFSRDELQEVKVFPKRLKDSFWQNIHNVMETEDPFIGVM